MAIAAALILVARLHNLRAISRLYLGYISASSRLYLDVVAHARREAVRPDEQVEGFAAAVVEAELDAAAALVDRDEPPAQPHRPLLQQPPISLPFTIY